MYKVNNMDNFLKHNCEPNISLNIEPDKVSKCIYNFTIEKVSKILTKKSGILGSLEFIVEYM